MADRLTEEEIGRMVEHAREAHGQDRYYEIAPNAFLKLAEELSALRDAAVQHEADIARAKREVLDELQNLAEGLSHDGVVPDLADAYDEAATRLRRKYSDPTAVAATEKEG